MLDKKIERRFTKALENSQKTVYDLFTWKKVDISIRNRATGEIITHMQKLEFPENYSQSACDIISGKYFRKRGVGGERDSEYSMRQVVHRMVSFWCDSMKDAKLINDEQYSIVYDELVYSFLDQRWAPNSPQWFNTGLKIYGIEGKNQGHYYYDENLKEVVESKDTYSRTQGSACFITSVKDSLLGDKSLTDQMTTETLLFKYGSGVGSNWSAIRAKNERLSGGGRSSGLLSFLKVSDRNAGAIKSGGTTRRAAKMNILDIDHPEILEYINWKAVEEEKVVALSKMGYSADLEGEAYETVSGQNANNSVRINNEFMSLLEVENASFFTSGRVDSSVDKEINVKDLWEQLAKAAWRCGDPGVQFDDIINVWHTCPGGEDGKFWDKHNRINASNPCSEYMFLDDTACNLASINLMKYYDNKNFNHEDYLHTIMLVQMALETTIHSGQFPTKDIARKSYVFRTTGLGFANLGTLLMTMGLPYDSPGARNVAAALASILTGYAYYTSALMAEKLGTFSAYEINKTHMLKVIKNHACVANYKESEEPSGLDYDPVKIDHELLKNLEKNIGSLNLSKTLKEVWENTIEAGENHGFRNAQVSALAPTGTIAFAMDCATTGIEPFFSHIAYKKLVGGSYMEIVNPTLKQGLKNLGYGTKEIKAIVDYVLRKKENMPADGKIEGAPYLKEEHYPIFDTANKCGTGERFIAPQGHVKMMGALSPHITGAISKTVNLPHSATVEDVKNIYLLSFELGVKAIALYRDNCKTGQPLNTVGKSEKRKIEDYSYNELLDHVKKSVDITTSNYKLARKKLRGIRRANVHEVSIDGLKLYITTSFYNAEESVDRRLGEIFISSGKQGSLEKGLLESISMTISKMLQYGIPAKDVSRMYRGQKYSPSGPVTGHPYIKQADSISDLISKIIDVELEDYTYCQIKPHNWNGAAPEIPKATNGNIIYGEVCYVCKSTKLVKSGICKVCTECGNTTGCS